MLNVHPSRVLATPREQGKVSDAEVHSRGTRNLYSSYSYGVYYSFFEAFPIVYTGTYGFSLGLTGTAFLSIVIACLVGSAIYVSYLYWYLVGTPKTSYLD